MTEGIDPELVRDAVDREIQRTPELIDALLSEVEAEGP